MEKKHDFDIIEIESAEATSIWPWLLPGGIALIALLFNII